MLFQGELCLRALSKTARSRLGGYLVPTWCARRLGRALRATTRSWPGFPARLSGIRAKSIVVGSGVLTGLILALCIALMAWSLRAEDVTGAEQQLTTIAAVLGRSIDRDLQTVDLVQAGIVGRIHMLGIETREALQRHEATHEAYADLRQRIAPAPWIEAMALLDAEGRNIVLSRAWPAPAGDDSGRDFVRIWRAPPAADAYVSAPRQTNSGEWVLSVSRPITNRTGVLIGIVVATVRVDHFNALFADIVGARKASFALHRADGVLLASRGDARGKRDHAFGKAPAYAQLATSLGKGAIWQAGMVDGTGRLVATRRLPRHGLLLGVTETADSILGRWREEVAILASGLAVLELALLGAVALGLRHLRTDDALREATMARDRAELAQALAEQRECNAAALHRQAMRFHTALDHLVQGVVMVDREDRLVVANQRFHELYRVPYGALFAGMLYADMVEQIVQAGAVSRADIEQVRRRRSEMIRRNRPTSIVIRFEAGRIYSISHRPMPDGWVSTYEDITERQATEDKLVHQARHDALTGLPNRVLFHERLRDALRNGRAGSMLALHCVDLDDFKKVNDTLGHPMGDRLLKAAAERLVQAVRSTDVVARFGGDEFAVLQTRIRSPEAAGLLAERLIQTLENVFQLDEHQIVVGASIGIAVAPQDASDPDELLKCADLALYRAKAEGRGTSRLFHKGMDAIAQERRVMECELRQALPARQLEVFYQSQLDVRSERVVGCEALLRWRHPAMGLVPPDKFIPLAEATGLIVPIGAWVLRDACRAAAAWPDDVRVAVNLSPVQFRSTDLVGLVESALADTGLDPQRLELEVTETVMLQDTETTLMALQGLRKLGVCIALDDFGTGYSSLNYLRRFPFTRIKIDRCFVQELGNHPDCLAIVRAVTAMAHDLQISITAEGVETRQQRSWLASVGCDEVQGYLFSRPVPEAEMAAMLRDPAAARAPDPETASFVPEGLSGMNCAV